MLSSVHLIVSGGVCMLLRGHVSWQMWQSEDSLKELVASVHHCEFSGWNACHEAASTLLTEPPQWRSLQCEISVEILPVRLCWAWPSRGAIRGWLWPNVTMTGHFCLKIISLGISRFDTWCSYPYALSHQKVQIIGSLLWLHPSTGTCTVSSRGFLRQVPGDVSWVGPRNLHLFWSALAVSGAIGLLQW